MKLFFFMRGPKHAQDRFIGELQGKYFDYPTDKGKFVLGTNVQPVTLWCLGFPKDGLQLMLNTIKPDSYHKATKAMAFGLRKLLGLKKVPKRDKSIEGYPICDHASELVVIGLKEDGTFDAGEMQGGESI